MKVGILIAALLLAGVDPVGPDTGFSELSYATHPDGKIIISGRVAGGSGCLVRVSDGDTGRIDKKVISKAGGKFSIEASIPLDYTGILVVEWTADFEEWHESLLAVR